jgi:hypothetical protein
MIDIETRPDLSAILTQCINTYKCTFKGEDLLIIPVTEFQKNNWYGITLHCPPKRNEIDAYICVDKNAENVLDAYLKTFWNVDSLETIIKESIDEATTCYKCSEKHEMTDMCIINKRHVCKECARAVM